MNRTSASTATPRLVARALACERNDRFLFKDLGFELQPHQTLLLEGQNGSGKTSLLRILCGIRLQDEGEVLWNGTSIQQLGGEYHARVAYVGHHNGIKLELTVRENLRMARMLGTPSAATDKAVLQRVGLYAHADSMAYVLSAGQRRRLALARLLATDSLLWILDEPFTSLDKAGIELTEQLIGEHTQQGGMVIMTSHHSLSLHNSNVQRINLSA